MSGANGGLLRVEDSEQPKKSKGVRKVERQNRGIRVEIGVCNFRGKGVSDIDKIV